MYNDNDFTVQNGNLVRYNSPGGDVLIPAGITRIGDRAFKGCTGLSVTIPRSIARINRTAFEGCAGLVLRVLADSYAERYAIRRGIRIEYLPPFAIENGVLTKYLGPRGDVAIPESVTEIGEGAFGDCPRLTIHTPAGSCAERYAREGGVRLDSLPPAFRPSP